MRMCCDICSSSMMDFSALVTADNALLCRECGFQTVWNSPTNAQSALPPTPMEEFLAVEGLTHLLQNLGS